MTDAQSSAVEAVEELAAMLDAAEEHEDCIEFVHSPKEIGLHVMKNHQAIRAAISAMPAPSDQEKLVGEWRSLDDCPVNEYVLFRFDGPFHDSECPGAAVGKLHGDCTIWLTAVWAGSSAHDDPVAWAPLPITRARTQAKGAAS